MRLRLSFQRLVLLLVVWLSFWRLNLLFGLLGLGLLLRLLFRLLLGPLLGFLFRVLLGFLSALGLSLGLNLGIALFGGRRLASASESNRGDGGQRQGPLHARDLAGATVDDDLRGPAGAFIAGEVDALLDVDAILIGLA